MAASHGLRVQTTKLTAENQHIQFLADCTNGRAYATVLRLSVAVVVVSCNVMYCGQTVRPTAKVTIVPSRDKGLVPKEMTYGLSNGHMIDDFT